MILKADDKVVLIYHELEEGVLFWRGPWHNQVVPLEKQVMTRGYFNVPNKSRAMLYKSKDLDVFDTHIPSIVTYKIHKFASPLYMDRPSDIWYVMIYGDKEEQLLRHLEETVKSLLWLLKALASLIRLYSGRSSKRYGQFCYSASQSSY